jgi:hypothetical protein
MIWKARQLREVCRPMLIEGATANHMASIVGKLIF